MYALLGENGAGKSTTVEILEGHRTRTSGDVSVLGTDPGKATRDFRNRIGIVLQTSGVEHELSVREALTIYGSSYARTAPGGRGGRARRPRCPDRPAGGHAVGRPATAARPGPRDRRPAGTAVPRRADHRLRPGGSPAGVGAHPCAVLRWHHGAADDPLPRRGRAPRRPRRRPGGRSAGRRGHARAAGRCRHHGRPLRPAGRHERRRPRRCRADRRGGRTATGSSSRRRRRRRPSTPSRGGRCSGVSSSPGSW